MAASDSSASALVPPRLLGLPAGHLRACIYGMAFHQQRGSTEPLDAAAIADACGVTTADVAAALAHYAAEADPPCASAQGGPLQPPPRVARCRRRGRNRARFGDASGGAGLCAAADPSPPDSPRRW
jgi:hypothetical protein